MVGQADPGRQKGASEFIIFNEFEGMDTQSAREGLNKKMFAWLENLEPVADNKLEAVPAPAAALVTLTGETITRMAYASFANAIWEICFCQSGAAYGVNLITGLATKFAPPGTFSPSPDSTTFAAARLLIFDSQAGYCSWDGKVFVQQGGVSPNFAITAGGSGYTTGATVAITGGSGGGATAIAVVVAGVVTGIILTATGAGYKPGDTLTVTISPVGAGSGATANAHPWPFITAPTTGCVAFGRVWLGAGRVLIVTGVGSATFGAGYDDFSSADASLTTVINDADLVTQITALRYLNNYVFIIGDNSVKSVGSISVSSNVTSFSIVTLSSDQGTLFQQTVLSYNRLVLFANPVGVYAVFGASVEKISGPMDGVFKLVDFSQTPCAATQDLHTANHTYLLLVRYQDPIKQATRSIILAYNKRKWFVISQGDNLKVIATAIFSSGLTGVGITQTFGSSAADVTQLLTVNSNVAWKLQTALVDEGDPIFTKRSIKAGVGQFIASISSLVMTVDTELGSQSVNYVIVEGAPPTPPAPPANTMVWTTQGGKPMKWTTKGSPMNWTTGGTPPPPVMTTGFLWGYGNVATSGKYLGITLSGNNTDQIIQSLAIEYQRGQAWS